LCAYRGCQRKHAREERSEGALSPVAVALALVSKKTMVLFLKVLVTRAQSVAALSPVKLGFV
jgi:hypothetical protein